MKITDIYNKKDFILSFEIFPPKGDLSVETARETVKELIELKEKSYQKEK